MLNVCYAGGKVFLLDGAGSRGTATAKSATYGATKADVCAHAQR